LIIIESILIFLFGVPNSSLILNLRKSNYYDIFYDKLTGFLPLKEEVKEKLYTLTRPQEEEDITKHKRSGKVGGYNEKLKPETIREINNQLKDVLLRFDYAF